MARHLNRLSALILITLLFQGCKSPTEEFEDVLMVSGTYRTTLTFPVPDQDTPDPFKGEVEITFRVSDPIGPGSFSATASEQRIDGGVVKSPAVPTGSSKLAIPYTIEWTVQFWVYDEATSGPDPVLFYEVTVEKQNGQLTCRRARGRGGITLWEVESCQVEKL